MPLRLRDGTHLCAAFLSSVMYMDICLPSSAQNWQLLHPSCAPRHAMPHTAALKERLGSACVEPLPKAVHLDEIEANKRAWLCTAVEAGAAARAGSTPWEQTLCACRPCTTKQDPPLPRLDGAPVRLRG